MACDAYSTSRRALLSGFVATSILSGTAIAAATVSRPDAELLSLCADLIGLRENSSRLNKEVCRLEALCFEMAGAVPAKPVCRAEAYTTWAEFDAAMERWDAANRTHTDRLVDAGKAVRLNDAERAADAADDLYCDGVNRLTAMQAKTLAGLTAKAKIAAMENLRDLDASIVADLIAIGGAA